MVLTQKEQCFAVLFLDKNFILIGAIFLSKFKTPTLCGKSKHGFYFHFIDFFG